MKDWKVNQELFHRLNKEHRDDLNEVDVVISENVKEEALRHFIEHVDEWIYPAKSFVVAYCYAAWLTEDFAEDFWLLLNDPDLLYGNDPHFVTVSEDHEGVYDFLMENVGLPIPSTGMVPDIREYYEEECLENNCFHS